MIYLFLFYSSSQHHVVTIYFLRGVLVNYVSNDSSRTFYIALQDPGQIVKVWDCPRDSGTVPEFPGQLEPMSKH